VFDEDRFGHDHRSWDREIKMVRGFVVPNSFLLKEFGLFVD